MRIIQFAGQRGDIMARNQVSGQIEEVQENFVTVTGIGRIKLTSSPPKYQVSTTPLYLKVDRRYWYPEDPPVPSCCEPIIRWTMMTWLSASNLITFSIEK